MQFQHESGSKVPNVDAIASLSAWDLQVIVTVAERGTLIAAAQALKVSQSSLSRAIARLERILKVVLFARSTRRMDLTPAGQEFVSIAERVLNDLQLALANMQEVANEKRGQVLISTFPQFAQEVLPRLIATFRKDRINTEFHVRTGRNPEVVEDVSSGLADFGITFGDTAPDTLESVRLKRDILCALIPSTHELAKSTAPLPLAKLAGATMVSLPRETYTRKLIDGAAAAGHVTLNNAVIVPGFLEQMTHTRAGVGISIVPKSTLPGPCPRHVTVRLIRDPQLDVSITMLSLRGRHMSPAAISFRNMVIEAMSANEPKVRKAS